jgi:hypothetical protein
MVDFIQLFAEHVTPQQLTALQRARDQDTVDALFTNAELPLRDGCAEKITVAA